jgi:hypothetical protein
LWIGVVIWVAHPALLIGCNSELVSGPEVNGEYSLTDDSFAHMIAIGGIGWLEQFHRD